MNRRRLRPLAPWVLVGLTGLAVFGVLRVHEPRGGARNSICLIRRATGIPCPACGLTRASAHLAKGEIGAAFRAHPLVFLVALEVGGLWLAWGWLLWANRPWPAAFAELAGAAAVGQVALFSALWLGRFATGTLPW